MKKKFILIVTAILFASFILTGCSDSQTNSEQNYDWLLQMPKSYIGEEDRIEIRSWEHYKELTFSNGLISGAIATIECVDTDFYITIRNDGEDTMISGKSVSKCKVVAVGETFNGYNVKSNSIIEIIQDYYLMPTNETELVEMFESFGAHFIKDSTGEIVKLELKDGDYPLRVKKGVDYKMQIGYDELPMEQGIQYTGVIIHNDSKNFVNYLSPVEETQRYDVFQMSTSVKNIAAEIKEDFAKE